MSSHSMEFEYLNDVPVMTLDVNEDFKGDKIKCANMIEKVGTVSACVKIRNHQVMLSLPVFPRMFLHVSINRCICLIFLAKWK